MEKKNHVNTNTTSTARATAQEQKNKRRITRERLAALSPIARQLAEIAIAEGIWVLVDEKTDSGAPPSRGAQHGDTHACKPVGCGEHTANVMSRVSQRGEHAC